MALDSEIMADRERRRMEVRQNILAKSKLTKKKFMTPERKKALRKFIRDDAIKRIHRQQKEKEILRTKTIAERCGQHKNWNELSEGALQELCKEYQNRIYGLNEQKWELELATNLKEVEINDIAAVIVDQRGKFVVPPLKKISKYQTQLEKMRQWTFKLAKLDMRGMLKPVKREIELDEKVKTKEVKPEWAAENKIAKTPTTPGLDKNREFDDWNKSSTSLASSKANLKKEKKEAESEEETESEEEEEESSSDEEDDDEGELVELKQAQ